MIENTPEENNIAQALSPEARAKLGKLGNFIRTIGPESEARASTPDLDDTASQAGSMELAEAAVQQFLAQRPRTSITLSDEAPSQTLLAQNEKHDVTSKEVESAPKTKAEADEMAELKATKHAEIKRIESAISIATDTEVVEDLKELRERVGNAKSIQEIRSILGSISSATNAAMSKAGDKMSDAGAMHKEFYATNAEYRETSDKVWKESKEETAKFDKKQDVLDKIAKDKGYTTTKDKEREEVEAEIKRLEAKGGEETPELLKARLKRLDIIKDQNDERAEKARGAGDKENQEKYKDHKPVIEEQEQIQKTLRETLKKAFIKAYKENLIARGVDVSDTKAKDAEAAARFEKIFIEGKTSDQVSGRYKEIEEATMRLMEEARMRLKNAAVTVSPETKPNSPAASQTIEKLVADSGMDKTRISPIAQVVSAAQTLVPSDSPAQKSQSAVVDLS